MAKKVETVPKREVIKPPQNRPPGPPPGLGNDSSSPMYVTGVGAGGAFTADTELPAAAALGDAGSNPTTSQVGANNLLWYPTGSQWQRERNNYEEVIVASAARTATFTSSDFINYNARGAIFFLNITATPSPSTETLQLTVIMKNGVSSTYAAVTAFDTLAANTLGATPSNPCFPFLIYPGATPAPVGAPAARMGIGRVQGLVLPRNFRIEVVHSSTGSWTYSITASYIV